MTHHTNNLQEQMRDIKLIWIEGGHVSFLDAVIESKSKILISGYDCELYDRLTENGFTKIKFEVKTMDGNFNKKTKTETLWRNY